MTKKSLLLKVKSIELDKNKDRVFGIKSAILWGHSSENNSMFPLLYISKPRSVSQEDFEELIEKLDLTMRR